jgi:hypothetical protein
MSVTTCAAGSLAKVVQHRYLAAQGDTVDRAAVICTSTRSTVKEDRSARSDSPPDRHGLARNCSLLAPACRETEHGPRSVGATPVRHAVDCALDIEQARTGAHAIGAPFPRMAARSKAVQHRHRAARRDAEAIETSSDSAAPVVLGC